MIKVIYYVACSLDSYIATEAGTVEWLEGYEDEGEDHGYGDMYGSVDTLLMGRGTYDFAHAQPDWPYPDKKSIVFTSRDLEGAHSSVRATQSMPQEVVAELAAKGSSGAWLLGGGKLASAFYEAGLITHLVVTFIPVVLGAGIPLFAGGGEISRLKLELVRDYPSGLVQMSYRIPA